MPYKNREIQKQFLKDWREDHKEEIKWEYMLWVENNRERRNEINREYRKRHKDYLNTLSKLKRKLNGVEK